MKQAVTVIFIFLAFSGFGQKDSLVIPQGKNLKVGLVLSGGGAKGLAHIGVLKEIEKAIVNFPNLGASPSNDGEIIRVTMPELTEDRRKEYVKIVKQKAEDCKVAIRNVRRKAKDDLDALKSEVGDDEVARAEKELEAITKRATDAADEAFKKKEAELLEV